MGRIEIFARAISAKAAFRLAGICVEAKAFGSRKVRSTPTMRWMPMRYSARPWR